MTASAATRLQPSTGPKQGTTIHLDEWVAPDVCDERGLLRAGKILEWMDVVGCLCAMRHVGKAVVTASVDGLHMKQALRVGTKLTLSATLAHTSERSIGVAVALSTADKHQRQPALGGYMTLVALDENSRAMIVPQFVPETADEHARFREGALRREFRKKLSSGQLSSSHPGPHGQQEQLFLVRELLKVLPRQLRMPWDRNEAQQERTRHHSYIHKIEMVRFTDLNFHDTLYGGTLMRWIESAAQLSARAYLDGAAVRLAGLHGLTFIRPVRRNVFVHIRSVVVHTNARQLTVLVEVQADDPVSGLYEETLRALLTYTPVEDSCRVTPLVCTSDDDRALFAEVEHRLALQKQLT